MDIELSEYGFELIYVIINHGSGSKIVKSAKRHGISGATVTLGKGTAHSRIMEYLGLSDIRKEIVFLLADKDTAFNVLDDLNKEFEFDKPNHGIAFTTSILSIAGMKSIICKNKTAERGDNNIMYRIITVIVDKGKAEDAVAAAEKAGSRGATIMNARGSGIHETSKLFSMEIEPEKEVVLILAESETAEKIVSLIFAQLKMDEPGNGIIYIQDADKVYGIR